MQKTGAHCMWLLVYLQFRWPVSMARFWPLNEWLWLRGQLRIPLRSRCPIRRLYLRGDVRE